MRKSQYICILWLIFTTLSFGQTLKPIAQMVLNQKPTNNSVFQDKNLLSVESTPNISVINSLTTLGINNSSTLFNLNKSEISQLIQNPSNTIQLSIPQRNGIDLVLELVRVNIFAPDFKIVTSSGDTLRPAENDRGIQYNGIVKGDNNSIVAISIFKDEISGLISTQKGNKVLGRLKGQQNYILYDDNDLQQPTFSCGTSDDATPIAAKKLRPIHTNVNDYCDLIQISIEADYQLFLDKGNANITETSNYVINLFNQGALLFRNDGIAIAISEMNIWTTPDPYRGIGNCGTLLNTIVANRGAGFAGMIHHFLTTINPNTCGGVANLVYPYNKSLSHGLTYIYDDVELAPIFSKPVKTFVHELGHSLGSHHTHWCGWAGGAIDGCAAQEGSCGRGPIPPVNGGTIMSYCDGFYYNGTFLEINFSLGFGSQPLGAIKDYIYNYNPTYYVVTPPTNLTVIDLPDGSVELSWNPNASTTFNVEIDGYVNSETKLTSYKTTLSPGSSHTFRVFGECGGWSNAITFVAPGLKYQSLATYLCKGTTFDVPYNLFGNYILGPDNFFIVEIKSPNGVAIEIGRKYTSSKIGVITCTIPSNIDIIGTYYLRTHCYSSNLTIHGSSSSGTLANCCKQSPIEWQKTLGGNLDDEGKSVIQTSDGGYLMLGNSSSTNGDISTSKGGMDIWLTKLDAQRNMIWQKNYGGSGADYGNSVVESDDGYVFTGNSSSNDGDISGNKGNSDIWIVKVNKTSGAMIWQKRIGSSGSDEANNIIKTPGGYIITGFVYNNDFDLVGTNIERAIYVCKIDENGIVKWQNTYGEIIAFGMNNGRAATVTSDGSIFITGSTYSNTANDTHMYILKLNSFGTKLWHKIIGGSSNDEGTTITTSKDGGIVAAGYTYSDDGDLTGIKTSPYYKSDFFVVKLDANGNIVWKKVIEYDSYSDLFANTIVSTADGGYLIGGQKYNGYIAYLNKINSLGESQWSETFFNNGNIRINNIFKTPDNGFLIGGTTDATGGNVAFNKGGKDYWLVKLFPDMTISKPNATQYSCQGETITLDMTNCTGAVLWGNGSSNNSIMVTPTSNNQVYSASCTNNDCVITETFKSVFYQTPTAPTITSNQDTVVCSGSNVTLFSSCVGATTWNTGTIANSIIVSPINSSTYTATCEVCSNNSPNGSITVGTVTQPTIPTVNPTGTQTICPNTNTSISLTASNCNGKFQWSNGAFNISTITVNTLGTYSTFCTNACGTSIASSQFVLANPTISQVLSGIGSNGSIKVSETIISAQNLNNGINSIYQAGRSIILNPNFTANSGSVFKAEIGTCLITAGLVASYNFNNNIQDQSGNGRNAGYNNGISTTGRKGDANGAYSFNGVNQRINIGNWFNFQQFSISMWVKAGETQSNAYAVIIDNNHTGSRSWVSQQDNLTTNSYSFGVNGSPAVGYGYSLSPNQWAHIVLIKAENGVSVYKNGILLGTNPYSGTINYDGTQYLTIGWWAAGTRFWNGSIDDLKIYNRALSEVEVSYLFSE